LNGGDKKLFQERQAKALIGRRWPMGGVHWRGNNWHMIQSKALGNGIFKSIPNSHSFASPHQ
jgi:hypothetical protein